MVLKTIFFKLRLDQCARSRLVVLRCHKLTSILAHWKKIYISFDSQGFCTFSCSNDLSTPLLPPRRSVSPQSYPCFVSLIDAKGSCTHSLSSDADRRSFISAGTSRKARKGPLVDNDPPTATVSFKQSSQSSWRDITIFAASL